MSSPPLLSPPAPGANKRRISLPVHQQLAQKKPKTTPGSSASSSSTGRKGSIASAHPLRQTSFPPQEKPGGNTQQQQQQEDEEDEDAGRDDYGTTVLADGGTGGFQEDDEEKKRMAILLEAFDADQNSRYESFRRANLNKAAVKKLANSVLSQSVTANVGTVICGFSKVFTGEIIELALQIQRQWGDEGPLLPDHLREAWRRYKIERQGAIGFRGAVGGGSPVANGGGPGLGDTLGGGVGRLFR
ncbi:hTAFII28-like protein conserved region-domain-containing protein [Pyronema domesticum]|uniref:Transcription initiation factor TFIID subunit 11 n=1 Tax=Pyronema omphalodes (strain CBS 100304) TaxID=1076935 RepID=U4LM69_PYROM|nr:hTAFII28-like protein conserved region-domain-containing protein [Pyronema domesticum]CCX32687.1 Similar to Transcription initiation factor TFIID subunit 11; acc. no. Q9US54 [Pyronema omphalodes CBS 100304]